MSEIKPIDIDDPIIEDCVEAGRVLLNAYQALKAVRPGVIHKSYNTWLSSVRELEDILAIDPHVRETRQL